MGGHGRNLMSRHGTLRVNQNLPHHSLRYVSWGSSGLLGSFCVPPGPWCGSQRPPPVDLLLLLGLNPSEAVTGGFTKPMLSKPTAESCSAAFSLSGFLSLHLISNCINSILTPPPSWWFQGCLVPEGLGLNAGNGPGAEETNVFAARLSSSPVVPVSSISH